MLLTGAGSCSVSRHLPEDVYMLDKVKVMTDGKYNDINPSQMKSYVRQTGNARWFSAIKIPLGIYAMAGKDSSWINRTLRQMGEAPVIYDTLLHPGQPYYINDYSTDIQDSVIARLIAPRKTLLHNGLQFSTDALNTERSQLTTFLQDQGYFRFHKEFITYRAHKDTARHEVGLTMVLHPYRVNSEAKDTLHSRYWIRNISYESGALNDSSIHLRPIRTALFFYSVAEHL